MRAKLGALLSKQTGMDLPLSCPESSLLDINVQATNGEWSAWAARVPQVEIQAQVVTALDADVPTMDTVRREEVLSPLSVALRTRTSYAL